MFKDEDFAIFENSKNIKSIIPPILEKKEENIKVIKRNTLTTKHEIIIPNNLEYEPFEDIPSLDAKEYSFVLDEFQKISLTAIERDESILVAAHTSSGKTVVAEYAIALSLKKKQRVIYTSPIKALSNQKYRELESEFGDVGLMTGDITLNPQATCLVMTTEILRNMLYRGSEVVREVHWIIFDEIHYMRDKERGVVWEETIILLPTHAKMIFLSATIPNALEFTSWVAKIHNQILHVVYTDKRVTPLTHFIVPKGGRGLYKVKYFNDEIKKDFFDKNAFLRSMKNLTKKRIGENDMKNVIEILLEENCLPSIVFSFSRKDCEKFALSIENNFLNDQEKENVNLVFRNALASLRKEDRDLPLITNLLPLLERGIGIHHSGLLPILKEIVELLFQDGLIKILFATETFSIGLNMPAKSVIFTSLKKFDGNERRLVSPGEYIQMSGRAGRRGIDEKGIVILMLGEEITTYEGSELLSGLPDKLNSAFKLSYNMILNLTRVEGLDPLYLLSRSFFHYQKINERISLFNFINDLYNKIPERPKEGKYLYNLYKQRNELKLQRQKELNHKFIDLISKGVVIDIFYVSDGIPYLVDNAIVDYYTAEKVEVNYYCDGGIIKKAFPLSSVDNVYKAKVKPEMRNFLRDYDIIKLESTFDKKINEIEAEIKDAKSAVPFNKCLLCMNLSKSCSKACRFIYSFDRYLKSETEDTSFFKTFFSPHTDVLVEHFRVEKIESIYLNKHKDYQKLVEIYHMGECQKMLRVLKRLNYCDDRSILPKGKIACEISSGHELILTEMIFNGEFNKMDLEDIVALLSCFVFEEWQSDEVDISDQSKTIYKVLKNTAIKIVEELNNADLDVEPDSFLRQFSYEIMDVVRLWVCGHTFGEICSKTDIFEGSIIRCFRRLEELLRQMSSAARVIGNVELENIFAIGITKIKRDIVFAGSLYL